jgi:transposase
MGNGMGLLRELSEAAILELEAKDKMIKERREGKRLQSVLLRVREGKSAAEIAKQLGLHPRTVQKHQQRYFKEGLSAFDKKPMGTRGPRLLRVEQEAELLESVAAQAAAGQLITARQLKRLVEEKAGKACCLGSVYGLLKRNNWSKKQPRPRHPKGCEEAKSLFKKTP